MDKIHIYCRLHRKRNLLPTKYKRIVHYPVQDNKPVIPEEKHREYTIQMKARLIVSFHELVMFAQFLGEQSVFSVFSQSS